MVEVAVSVILHRLQLLPCHLSDPDAVSSLNSKFEVSEELVGWQLLNADGIVFSPDERTILSGITNKYF